MTDPNIPPPERPIERPADVHHTTVNVAPDRSSSGGGGGGAGLIIGAIVVIALIVAAVLFLNNAPTKEAGDTNLDVNIDVPSMPELPDAPKMPDLPSPAPAQ